MRGSLLRNILLGILLTGLLAACQTAPTAQPPARTATAAATGEAPRTPTPPPTPTDEPPRVLVIRPDAAGGQVQAVEAAVRELAGKSGMAVASQSSISDSDLTPATRIVLVFPPDPGLAALAQGAPEVQFLALGIAGLKPAANLSLAGGDDLTAQEAFLAGYIAAIVTPDWRVGVLVSSSTEDAAARDAFLNGARYLCGICNPKTPPYPGYPVAVEGAAGDYQSAADLLKKDGVSTVFVAPSLADPALYSGLAGKGFNLVGTEAAADAYKPKWVATIRTDPASALRGLWDDLTAGKGGAQVGMPLVVDPSALLTPGRMRLVDQVREDLTGGWINPNAVDTGQ